jgi:hypothetical protein
MPVLEFLIAIAIAFIILFGGSQVSSGTLLVGTFVMYTQWQSADKALVKAEKEETVAKSSLAAARDQYNVDKLKKQEAELKAAPDVPSKWPSPLPIINLSELLVVLAVLAVLAAVALILSIIPLFAACGSDRLLAEGDEDSDRNSQKDPDDVYGPFEYVRHK